MRITKKPRFIRLGGRNRKKVGEKWRGPRGRTNKLRRHKINRGHIPHPGYGTPKSLRGLHPSGMREIFVDNLKSLDGIDKETQALRVSSTVGGKKRIELQKRAEELGLKILNPKKIEAKKPKAAEKKEEKPKTEKEG